MTKNVCSDFKIDQANVLRQKQAIAWKLQIMTTGRYKVITKNHNLIFIPDIQIRIII